MKRVATLLFAIAGATGCATLKISVDVYKHQIASPFPGSQIEAAAQTVLANPVFQDASRRALYADYVARVRDVVVAKNAAAFKAAGKPDPTAAAMQTWASPGGILAKLDSAWAPVNTAASTVRAKALALVELHPSLCNTDSCPQVRQDYSSLQAEKRQFYTTLRNFRDQVYRALSVELTLNVATQLADSSYESLATVGLAVSEDVSGKVVAYPIFDGAIRELKQSSRDWANFGHDRFKAFGGSAQFVVVREGHVVFREKNLDFDPTPIIGAGTALAKLGLQVAAGLQTGGVGLAALGKAPGAAPAAAASPESGDHVAASAASIEARRELLVYRVRAKRQLLFELADLYEKAAQAKKDGDAKRLEHTRAGLATAITAYEARTKPSAGAP